MTELFNDFLVLPAFVELIFDFFLPELACSLVGDRFWKIPLCRHSHQLGSFMGPSSLDKLLGFLGIERVEL